MLSDSLEVNLRHTLNFVLWEFNFQNAYKLTHIPTGGGGGGGGTFCLLCLRANIRNQSTPFHCIVLHRYHYYKDSSMSFVMK